MRNKKILQEYTNIATNKSILGMRLTWLRVVFRDWRIVFFSTCSNTLITWNRNVMKYNFKIFFLIRYRIYAKHPNASTQQIKHFFFPKYFLISIHNVNSSIATPHASYRIFIEDHYWFSTFFFLTICCIIQSELKRQTFKRKKAKRNISLLLSLIVSINPLGYFLL